MPRLLPYLFVTVFLASCYSIKVDKPVTGLDRVELKQSFFFLGLIGDKEINLTEECPRGVSGIAEKFTFGDLFLTIITLGIYTPKTVYVSCAN